MFLNFLECFKYDQMLSMLNGLMGYGLLASCIHILQNLEIKKTNDEKKAAFAAQYAAEATLRRVHAAQKDEDMPPIEAILAPVEAELKLARQEVLLVDDLLWLLFLLLIFHSGVPLRFCVEIE